ncbi:MAG: class I SAM-dependent methyltransferase [Patescibacteria group bacterium]
MANSHPTRGYGLLEKILSKQRIKMANKLIPQRLRAGKILDIGCGGNPFFLLNTDFQEKYGLDASVKIINSNQNIILKHFDIEKNERLPFGDNYFDTIIMLAVWEHINPQKIENVLQEIYRILKPHGRFILTTPCPWSDKLLKFMAKLKLVSADEINDHKGGYNHNDIIKYLYRSGFDKEKICVGYFEVFLNNWAYADK